MSLQKSCLRPSRLKIYKVLVDLRVLLIRSGAFKSQEDSTTGSTAQTRLTQSLLSGSTWGLGVPRTPP